MAQPFGRDAGARRQSAIVACDEARPGRRGGARVPARGGKPAPHGGEVSGLVQEGEVVDGDDQRRRARRDDDRGGVDQVDLAGRPAGPAAPGATATPRTAPGGAGAAREPGCGVAMARAEARRATPPRRLARLRGVPPAVPTPPEPPPPSRPARGASTAPACRRRARRTMVAGPGRTGPYDGGHERPSGPARRVLVTGGSGFLGRVVVGEAAPARRRRGGAPQRRVRPHRRRTPPTRLFADVRPLVVVHLAARVGGIGYNQAAPADLYLANLLMGTHVIEAARRHGTDKTVLVGTVCSYPKFTPVPVPRGVALGRLPGGDQRALRHRQEGPADPRPGQRARSTGSAWRSSSRPTSSARATSSTLRSRTSSRRSSRSASTPSSAGEDKVEVWGTGRATPRVPLRRRRRRGHRPRRRARSTSPSRSTSAPTTRSRSARPSSTSPG